MPVFSKAPTVAACLIVKNEAENLPRCLASLRGLVDEIVVVDTGSSDDTVAIAESFGAKIGHFAWCDDFSAARNASLALATSDWALVIDADETLEVPDVSRWRSLLAGGAWGAYICPLHNVDATGRSEFSAEVLRLFRRLPGVQFSGRLHESVGASLRTEGLNSIKTENFNFAHTGYQEQVIQSRGKGHRNIQIASLDVQERPQDPKARLNLARSLTLQGAHQEAATTYAQLAAMPGALDSLESPDYVGFLMGYRDTLSALNRWSDVLVLLDRAIERLPDEIVFRYERGRARVLTGDLDGAIDDFVACLSAEPNRRRIWTHAGLTDEQPKAALRRVAERVPETKPRIEAWLLRASSAPDLRASKDWWHRLEAQPRDADAFLGLSAQFLEAEALDKALLAISQSIRLDAHRAEAYHLLGLILEGLGQSRLAERAFVGALALEPDHPTARARREASRARAKTEAVDASLEGEVEFLLKRQYPTVSACLTAKDDAENLARTLASLQGLVDEIVVVDRGSRDGTVAIARSFGAKVGQADGREEEATARNMGLALATGDWVLVLEPGETLAVENSETWCAALRDASAGAYAVDVQREGTTGRRVHQLVRLFLRDPQLRFTGPLGGSVMDSLAAKGLSVAPLAGVALHQGDAQKEELASQHLRQRTFQQAAAAVERQPQDPRAWFALARSSQFLGNPEVISQALTQVAHLLAAGAPMADADFGAYTLIHHDLLRREGREEEALALLQRGLERLPGFPEFLYLRGQGRQRRGEVAGARADFEACLAARGRFFLANVREDVTGALPQRALEALPR